MVDENQTPNPGIPASSVAPVPTGVVDPVASQPVPTQGVQMPPTSTPQTSYAGFWIRVLAAMIDGFILSIVDWIIIIFALAIGVVSFASLSPVNTLNSSDTFARLGLAGTMLIGNLILTVLNYVYFVVLTGLYGATLGKRVLGLRVVNESGQKIGVPRAILREVVGKIVSSLTLLIGYIMVGFDSKKQGLHDKIANTFVVKIR